MLAQGKLISLCNALGTFRNLLPTRITATVYQQQIIGLKTTTKDKLESLKIPAHPKRPLTPYFRFLNETRAQIQKKHPDWKLVQITKQCAEEWKNINHDIKEKYQQDFLDEMKIFKHKQEQYKTSLTKEQEEVLDLARKEKRASKKKRILKKRYRETEKPKRPVTTFLLFIKEKQGLPENKNKKLSELLSIYSSEWKNMTDAQKEKYTVKQKEDKLRYEKEMTAWEARMIKEGNTDIVRKDSQITTTAKPLQLKNVKPGKTR